MLGMHGMINSGEVFRYVRVTGRCESITRSWKIVVFGVLKIPPVKTISVSCESDLTIYCGSSKWRIERFYHTYYFLFFVKAVRKEVGDFTNPTLARTSAVEVTSGLPLFKEICIVMMQFKKKDVESIFNEILSQTNSAQGFVFNRC